MTTHRAGARRAPKVVMAILAHEDPASLRDLVINARTLVPDADLVFYNSGDDPALGADLDVEMFPSPARLQYSKVTRFFFDIFEWVCSRHGDFRYLVNLETDMLFIRPGFTDFLAAAMDGHDYMAPLLSLNTVRTSRWRPIRSLRPELPRWYQALGLRHTHRGFSPGQIFSRRYVEKLVSHPRYSEIKDLTAKNQSHSLQEVLFPTLADSLGVSSRPYPSELTPTNRYRPYQAVRGVRRALALERAYFVHPVRRQPDDRARSFILSLTATAQGSPTREG